MFKQHQSMHCDAVRSPEKPAEDTYRFKVARKDLSLCYMSCDRLYIYLGIQKLSTNAEIYNITATKVCQLNKNKG